MADLERTTTDINELLSNFNAGILKDQLEAVISEVARGVINYGGQKKGRVAVEFKFDRYGSNESQIEIAAIIKKEKPTKYGKQTEDVGSEQVFWVGRGGKVTFEQPKEDLNGQYALDQEQDGPVKARPILR